MANDELEELTIKKNKDLNVSAEYSGSRQDIEKKLLDAQRYLNVFHQIHIFNDKKKEEFNQSLLDMPADIRTVLMSLPGGNVLLEHIEDLEIQRGLRDKRTVFHVNEITSQRGLEAVSSPVNEELAKTIQDAMQTYAKNLSKINEQILQNSKQMNDNNNNQAKMLAEVLRENNKQQMEVVKTLGSTLSEAIKASQRRINVSNKVIRKEVKNNPLQFADKEEKTAPKAEPLKNVVETMEKPNPKAADQRLNSFSSLQNTIKPTFDGAMQKIKDAITEKNIDSQGKIKDTPISLNDIEDDLTTSFSGPLPTKESKEEKKSQQSSIEQDWEYVDENGNAINPEDWEYVDEDGNPIDPDEWEYVDEDGNPIDPKDWEYVDENGNPVK